MTDTSAQARELAPGSFIGPYRIDSVLGSGGMGMVYRARQVHLQRLVALKVMKPALAADEEFCERFMREARAGAAIDHAHVVRIYDADLRDGLLFQVFELVPGGDLAQVLKARGPLPPVEALRLIAECADGLQAIHRAGLLHRDLKPPNIFLDAQGHAKLGDLGMARQAAGGDQVTRTGTMMGTPAYMAPEQARGGAIDIRADIYALGATLYTLLTGRIPFPGANTLEVIAKVIADPTPDPRTMVPTVPATVAALVQRAMAKDRDQRHATPDDLRQELLRVAAGLPASRKAASAVAPDHGNAGSGGPAAPPRRRTMRALVAFAVLAVAVGGAVVWSRLGNQPAPATTLTGEPPPAVAHPPMVTPAPPQTPPPAAAAPAEPTAPWASSRGHDQWGSWADLTINHVTQRFRWIPAGSFTMGSPLSEGGRDSDELAHPVTLTKPFWLADSPTTQALWLAVMGRNPAHITTSPDLPVESVSWDDCQAFVAALHQRDPRVFARLPSEAEWEYACRAGTTGPLPGADLDALAWYQGNSGMTTHPVKQKSPNPWGLYDMLGNVWQWCQDWQGDYPSDPVRDPLVTTPALNHAIRGCCWGDLAADLRSAHRGWYGAGDPQDTLGLRLCLQVQP